jgi:GNAT superfamily N-acetyltransferase
MPARSNSESWQRRRAEYDRRLATPGAFVLLAEREGTAVGYALVSPASEFQGWVSGERVADVLDLVVVPEERGHGIGSALMEAVEHHVAAAGIAEFRLMVIAANAQALRFYADRGMTPISQTLLRRINVTD